MKKEGKVFHGTLGIKLKLKALKKIHSFLLLASTFSWLPALLPCPEAASSLLMVGLKSDEDVGELPGNLQTPGRAEKRMDLGPRCSARRVRRGTLEVIAGGHVGSWIVWTKVIPHNGDPTPSPKPLIPAYSGTCILHGKGLFLSKCCDNAVTLHGAYHYSFKVLRSTWMKGINVHSAEQAAQQGCDLHKSYPPAASQISINSACKWLYDM